MLLATGLLPWPDFTELAARTIPILLFVLAMTVVTELADAAGVFRVVTGWLASVTRWRWVLWLLVAALAIVSTVFLSLDTTAVLVTPVVVLLAMHTRMPPLPFALTTIWLANTASVLLPVSNLTNLLAQHRMGLDPFHFAALMWAPAAVAIVVPLAMLGIIFRRSLRGTYQQFPGEKVPDRTLLIIAGVTVALLLPALVSGVPVAIPAGIAAVVLLLVFAVRRRDVLSLRMLPWRPLALTVALFIVVQTLHAHALTPTLAVHSGFLGLLELAGSGVLAANVVNNLPAYLALEPTGSVQLAALLIGVNVGPLISPWASLATLLWHERLRSMGVNVSWGGFALAGLLCVVITVPLAVLALWLSIGAP